MTTLPQLSLVADVVTLTKADKSLGSTPVVTTSGGDSVTDTDSVANDGELITTIGDKTDNGPDATLSNSDDVTLQDHLSIVQSHSFDHL